MKTIPLARRDHVWIAVNIIGLALFLLSSSALWITPQDVGAPTGPGEAVYWVLRVAPILLVSFIGNMLFLIHIFRTRQRALFFRLGILLLMAAIWFTANSYSNARSMHQVISQLDGLHAYTVANLSATRDCEPV